VYYNEGVAQGWANGWAFGPSDVAADGTESTLKSSRLHFRIHQLLRSPTPGYYDITLLRVNSGRRHGG
jgi:hypothetical protein